MHGLVPVCVQVGDQLDRGDEELRILYFFERLQQEAAAAGGALHVLNGNHETMNIMGDSRYATAGTVWGTAVVGFRMKTLNLGYGNKCVGGTAHAAPLFSLSMG